MHRKDSCSTANHINSAEPTAIKTNGQWEWPSMTMLTDATFN